MRPTNSLAESFIFITLVALTGFAFSFGLDGIFLLDDYENILPTLIDSFDAREIFQIISSNNSGPLGRPISILSFSLTSLAHGDDVWGFKYHNILIHLLTGVVIYCLCKRILNLFEDRKLDTNYKIALFTTAVWLLHPLQVSTVMYAVQRMTQLSALFSFLAILVFLRGLQSSNNKFKVLHYFVLLPLSLLASIFSKENGVLTPVFLGLITIAILFSKSTIATEIKHRLKTNRYDQLFVLVFLILPLVIGTIGFITKFESFTDYSSRPFTLGQRLLSQIDFVFLYLNQLAFPRLSAMGLFFDDIPIPTQMTIIRAAKLCALTSLLIGGLVSIVRGKSILGIGILFFFCGHLLESTIFPLELAFEHRNYLPSFGVFLFICYFVTNLYQKFRSIMFLSIIWSGLLVTLLFLRLHYWSDAQEWQRTILAYHPKSERTQIEYIHTLYHNAGTKDVLEQIDKARILIPHKLSFPIRRLMHSCAITNEKDNKQIIKEIEDGLQSKPLTTIAANNLTQLVNVVLVGNCTSVSKLQVYSFVGMAIERLTQSNPKAARLGYLYYMKAKMELFYNNYELASSLYLQGFELTGDTRFMFLAAKVLLLKKDTREQGLALLSEISNNKYFYSAPYQPTINDIKTKVAENDFTFNF